MICRWVPLIGVWILLGLLVISPCGSFAEKLTQPKKATIQSIGITECTKFTLPGMPRPPQGRVGTLYRYQIKTNNSKISPTYKVVAGRLPYGLKVDTKGLVQGVPKKSGSYKFNVQAVTKCATAANRANREFVLIIQPRHRKLPVKCQPNAVTIDPDKASVHTINYIFPVREGSLRLYSNEGRFVVNNIELANVAKPLVVALKQPSGQAVELLTVSPAVIKAARKHNAQQISYVREFKTKDKTTTACSAVSITIAPKPALKLREVTLFFKHPTKLVPKKQITPPQIKPRQYNKATTAANQAPPPLYAEVLLSRPGVFEGFWQVNGKPVTRLKSYKANERRLIVPYPEKSGPLGKLQPGEHHILFVITKPKMKIPVTQALLVVQADIAPIPVTMKLGKPRNNSSLKYAALTFKWTAQKAIAGYTIEFSTLKDSKVFFSATSEKNIFYLKSDVLKHYFSPGKSYVWRIKGHNANKDVVAQSPAFEFGLKPLSTFVSGQIVVITEANPGSRIILDRLSKKYKLKTIETAAIRTLKRTATIFSTHDDVRPLVKQISKEHGVVHAQANNLYRTMVEPKNDLQEIYKALNLTAVHHRYQGKGVRVAIIDTGVDIRHPDLKKRVVQHTNFIRNNPYRPEIHGTALAGIVAASINNYGITGIAPEAELMALRACWQTSEADPEGICTTISISKAIDMAIESNAQIVNMSLGSTASDGLMMQLLEAGAKNGQLFVAPVGNNKNREILPFPASHSKVLAVGGYGANGTPYPNAALVGAADVCAPASNIFTTVPGAGHNFLSGTSISAAIVSGILAVAKEKNRYLGLQAIPPYEGDLCRWQEQLIHQQLCGKRAN